MLFLVVVLQITRNKEQFAHFTSTKLSILTPYMAPQVADPENYFATFKAERNTTGYLTLFLLLGGPSHWQPQNLAMSRK